MMWSSSFETGISSVDEQHKELFRQVGILSDKSNEARVKATLDFLADYVVKHFGHEEMLQAKTRYPKAAEHKKLHTDLIGVYKDFRKEFDAKPDKQAVLLMKLTKTLTDWLVQHIKGADKEFAEYYLNTAK